MEHARDAVAYVVRRGVHVAAHVEPMVCRALVLAVGLELEDAFDSGDGSLDRCVTLVSMTATTRPCSWL